MAIIYEYLCQELRHNFSSEAAEDLLTGVKGLDKSLPLEDPLIHSIAKDFVLCSGVGGKGEGKVSVI